MHDPEPWTITGEKCLGTGIQNSKGHVVYLDNFGNRERVVALINAMAGIPACDLPRVRALWDQFKREGLGKMVAPEEMKGDLGYLTQWLGSRPQPLPPPQLQIDTKIPENEVHMILPGQPPVILRNVQPGPPIETYPGPSLGDEP